VQQERDDSPAGKAGSVSSSVHSGRQGYLALNGGTRSNILMHISFAVDCADQAEVDRLWDGLSKGARSSNAAGCGTATASRQIVPSILPKLLGDPTAPRRAGHAGDAEMVKLTSRVCRAAADGK